MAKAKKADAVPVVVPETYGEANTLLEQLGWAQRDLALKELRLAGKVAKLTALIEKTAGPLKARIKTLEDQIAAYATAHRKELLAGDTKHHDFPAGKVSWRLNPQSVELRGKLKVADVVAEILRLKLRRPFLRMKLELNKEAILADQEKAKPITGIRIAQGETFSIEPKGATLADGAP